MDVGCNNGDDVTATQISNSKPQNTIQYRKITLCAIYIDMYWKSPGAVLFRTHPPTRFQFGDPTVLKPVGFPFKQFLEF
jgi:hypothetical protein